MFTSAGISPGIDMSLKVVARYYRDAIARTTARHMKYPFPQRDERRIALSSPRLAGGAKNGTPLKTIVERLLSRISNACSVSGAAGQTFEIPAGKRHLVSNWQGPLVWLGWWYRLSCVTVKEPGWRGQGPHLLSLSRDRLGKNPPTHTASVDEESSGFDRRFDRKLTQVCPPQHPSS